MTTDYPVITNKDLGERQYTIAQIEHHMNRYERMTYYDKCYYCRQRLNLLTILRTQTDLTAEFCVNYILNETYQYSSSEDWITLALVEKEQPHLTVETLRALIDAKETEVEIEMKQVINNGSL
jgi:hypothetical protein